MTVRHPLALALGGGGPFGIAYHCGVLDELRAAGVPVADAPVLGTSAGSWAAAALRLGVPFERLAGLCARPPVLSRQGLCALALAAFGDGACPGLTATVVRLPRLRLEVLDAAEVPVHRTVAASSAVPGVFPPVRIGRRLYVDGGARPGAAALAPPADTLLAVAPLAGPVLRPLGPALGRVARREADAWRRAHGGAAVLLEPDAEVASLVRSPVGLFHTTGLHDVYATARAQVARWLTTPPAAPIAALAG